MEISNEIMGRVEKLVKDEAAHYKAEIERLEKKWSETVPMADFTKEHIRRGLVLLKDGQEIIVAQKRRLEILNYVLGNMAAELPDSLKFRTTCWIGALFNREHKCHEFRLYTRHFNPLQTFHTNSTYICLGDVSGIQSEVSVSQPDTLVAAFDRIMDMLQTLNPSSPLHHPTRGKLGNIWAYVWTEYQRWQRQNCRDCGKRTDELCDNCNLCGDCCDCFHCDCGTASDDSCSNCDSCRDCCHCRGGGNG